MKRALLLLVTIAACSSFTSADDSKDAGPPPLPQPEGGGGILPPIDGGVDLLDAPPEDPGRVFCTFFDTDIYPPEKWFSIPTGVNSTSIALEYDPPAGDRALRVSLYSRQEAPTDFEALKRDVGTIASQKLRFQFMLTVNQAAVTNAEVEIATLGWGATAAAGETNEVAVLKLIHKLAGTHELRLDAVHRKPTPPADVISGTSVPIIAFKMPTAFSIDVEVPVTGAINTKLMVNGVAQSTTIHDANSLRAFESVQARIGANRVSGTFAASTIYSFDRVCLRSD